MTKNLKKPAAPKTKSLPQISAMGFTPKQIVDELNRFIVGQKEAKKAVAIALRNRYRRKLVESPLREEIVPKNILMVGLDSAVVLLNSGLLFRVIGLVVVGERNRQPAIRSQPAHHSPGIPYIGTQH